MGRPDRLDRLVQLLLAIVALAAIANGAVMLWSPLGWYQAVPTVRFTGPANPHFIRDIGLAYLVSGLLLGWAAAWPYGRWRAAVLGSLWLSLHGAFHVWEVASGLCSPRVFWTDAPSVLGLPLIAWAGIAIQTGRRRIAPGGLLS